MEASKSSYAPSLSYSAVSPPRRCRYPVQLQRRRLAARGRRRASKGAVMFFAGRRGRDFGGELVDENMAVLRKRIHEVRMAEEAGDGGLPAHWMEWEKRHHGCYRAVVCDAVAMLQSLLLNTRPSVALGVVAIVAMSVPVSTVMVILRLMGGR